MMASRRLFLLCLQQDKQLLRRRAGLQHFRWFSPASLSLVSPHCPPQLVGRAPNASSKRWHLRALSAAAFHCPPHLAAVFKSHGAPDSVVELVEIPGRDLGQGEVCVKMLAAPINPSDLNKIEGTYPPKPNLPAVGGNEGVGVVVGVGDGVNKLRVNDWVIPGHSKAGTWSVYAIQEEAVWHKVPNDVPVEYLATMTVNPPSAFRMLKDFVTLQPGEIVVQNGATSIVGQCVIQLAHINGLQTINLVRDREDLEDVKTRLKQLGATHVFSESEAARIDKKALFAGQPAPQLGLNCVGGSAATAVLKLLGEGGTMVTYGGMAKRPIMLSTGYFIFKNVQLKGFWLQKWLHDHAGGPVQEKMTNELLDHVRSGKLKYPMEEVPFLKISGAISKAMGKYGTSPKQVLIFD